MISVYVNVCEPVERAQWVFPVCGSQYSWVQSLNSDCLVQVQEAPVLVHSSASVYRIPLLVNEALEMIQRVKGVKFQFYLTTTTLAKHFTSVSWCNFPMTYYTHPSPSTHTHNVILYTYAPQTYVMFMRAHFYSTQGTASSGSCSINTAIICNRQIPSVQKGEIQWREEGERIQTSKDQGKGAFPLSTSTCT